jgi:hypothetical protein
MGYLNYNLEKAAGMAGSIAKTFGSGSKAMRRLLSNALKSKNIHGPAAQAVKRVASKNPGGSFAMNTMSRGGVGSTDYVELGAVKNLLRNVYPKGGLLHPRAQSLVRPTTARTMSSNIV